MFDFDQTTRGIEGWLTKNEGAFLYGNAKKVKSGEVIVEIGSWKGRSTVCLASGSRDGNQVRVFAIDPHTGSSEHQKPFGKVDTFGEFKQNLEKAGIVGYVETIQDTSEKAAEYLNRPVGLIFIDGAHEYRFVKKDFKIWFPKVINGGIIAFHDTWQWLGPSLVTTFLLLTSSQIRRPRLFDTITCFEKIERNSFFDRMGNILFVFLRLFYGAIGTRRLRKSSFSN